MITRHLQSFFRQSTDLSVAGKGEKSFCDQSDSVTYAIEEYQFSDAVGISLRSPCNRPGVERSYMLAWAGGTEESHCSEKDQTECEATCW